MANPIDRKISMRVTALDIASQKATHSDAESIVASAEIYYSFLMKDHLKPTASKKRK